MSVALRVQRLRASSALAPSCRSSSNRLSVLSLSSAPVSRTEASRCLPKTGTRLFSSSSIRARQQQPSPSLGSNSNQRGLATHAEVSSLVVPTVDITPFREDPSSPAARQVVQTVAEACASTGFFQMTGHGVSEELQQAAFAAAQRFFALPFDEKCKLDAKKTIGHRGYDVLASQAYSDGLMPDLKEGFYVGEHLPPTDDKVAARRFFMGPNVWPPQTLIAKEAMQDPAEQYHAALLDLSFTVMRIIAAGLPYGPSVFDNFMSNHPAAPLRFLRYPKRAASDSPNGRPQFGSSAHTDFGAITLLLQDRHPGLQILDDSAGGAGGEGGEGRWVPVPPRKDAYVVNVGDMLSKWTGNRYKSSVHRVINENEGDRYSIVFFLDGNLDCALVPLDGIGKGEGKGEGKGVDGAKVLTVEEHMLRRMKESYGVGAAKN